METLSWSGRRGRRHARRASQGNTRNGGWFGGAQSAPELPLDTRVLTADNFATLTEALARNGFQAPTNYYLNHEVNARYASAALNNGTLDIPVLFIGAAYDQVADIRSPSALDPMRESCTDLSEVIVAAGHWLQLEAAQQVNRHLEDWLTERVVNLCCRQWWSWPRSLLNRWRVAAEWRSPCSRRCR